MKIIDAYIAKTVLFSIGLVTLMLSSLQLFILFVGQLESLDKGGYSMTKALSFVMLQMPYEVYLLFPMACLLGCLVGLGGLANHCELVVLRASGMSIGQITRSVFKVAMILVVLVTIMGEFFVPKLLSAANDLKTEALSGGQALRTPRGMWLKQNNDFLMIEGLLPNHGLHRVHQFHFDDEHRLVLTRLIEEAHWEKGVWYAQNIDETSLFNDHTNARHVARETWDVALNPNLLSPVVSPDEMTLPALFSYWHTRVLNKQPVMQESLVFWQRVIQPLTTMVMMWLAIPFIFGPLRQSTMGSKLLMGALVGFGFYIMNRMLGSMSQVYQWSPEIAAIVPTLLFMLLGLCLMLRAK